jgi:hypothetical protein
MPNASLLPASNQAKNHLSSSEAFYLHSLSINKYGFKKILFKLFLLFDMLNIFVSNKLHFGKIKRHCFLFSGKRH